MVGFIDVVLSPPQGNGKEHDNYSFVCVPVISAVRALQSLKFWRVFCTYIDCRGESETTHARWHNYSQRTIKKIPRRMRSPRGQDVNCNITRLARAPPAKAKLYYRGPSMAQWLARFCNKWSRIIEGPAARDFDRYDALFAAPSLKKARRPPAQVQCTGIPLLLLRSAVKLAAKGIKFHVV